MHFSNKLKKENKFNSSFSKIIRLSSLKYNKFKRINYFQFIFNKFFCFKKNNNLIDNLDNLRKNIISEEGLFTNYFILLTIINKNDIILIHNYKEYK